MTKYFIALLIVFALAGVVYRLNIDMRPSQNALLKTYTNDELGFSIAYPEDQKIKIENPVLVPKDANRLALLSEMTTKSNFATVTTHSATVYYVETERFEGVVSYKAYFFKDNFVVPIAYSWSGVDWTNPEYDSKKDPHFEIFMSIIKSINFIHTESGQYEGLN